MLKMPKSKAAKTAAETSAQAVAETPAPATTVKPFEYKRNPEVEAKIDAFLEAKGPEYRAQIDATPKEFFVRKWALRLVQQNEKVAQYYDAVERTLEQPEHAEFKQMLHKRYEKREISPEVKRRQMLREAGQNFTTRGVKLVAATPPPVPRMTP